MELELARLFVKVIQNQSFSKTADLLRMPKSTVSKAIARLEKETGTKLILRTTRSLTLTAAGMAFYQSCLGPVQSLEDAVKSLHGQDSILSGHIRLTAPEDLGSFVIAKTIAQLTTLHPQLSFELNYTDEVVDLVKDGFDLALRIGRIQESRLRQKKLGEVTLILVASPKYIQNSSRIRSPDDLQSHSCLTIAGHFLKWSLKSKKETEHVQMKTRVMCNQMTSLIQIAIEGAGIALVPSYLCRNEILSGRLTHILPSWHSSGLPVTMLSPLPFSASARLKLTADAIAKNVSALLQEN